MCVRMTSNVQFNVYGALTATEERRLQNKIVAAGRTDSYSARTEKALLAVVNADFYSKSLLLMQMAEFRELHSQRVSITIRYDPNVDCIKSGVPNL
jgi:hypothetical protein